MCAHSCTWHVVSAGHVVQSVLCMHVRDIVPFAALTRRSSVCYWVLVMAVVGARNACRHAPQVLAIGECSGDAGAGHHDQPQAAHCQSVRLPACSILTKCTDSCSARHILLASSTRMSREPTLNWLMIQPLNHKYKCTLNSSTDSR